MVYADMFRPVPGLRIDRPAALGKVFYVDSDGARKSDSNEGTDPDQPLITIAAALAKCTSNNGDYVIVLDCYNSDTHPINIDEANTHIIAMSMPTNWQWTVISSGNADVFEINAGYVEIAGFSMFSGGSYMGIELQTSAGMYWIHHNRFAVSQTALNYGIRSTAGTPSEGLIEDNVFGKIQTCITINGVDGALTATNIKNNTFCQVAGIAINLDIANIGEISGNKFYEVYTPAPSSGWAINLGSGCTNGIIMNNFASDTGDAQAEPYKDSSSSGATTLKNGWAGNVYGDAFHDPVASGG